MKGHIILDCYERGRLVWRREANNLVVTSALVPVSYLLGGHAGNYQVATVGFGSGAATPALGNTSLTAPVYYKPLDSVSYPTAGQVQLSWSIDGAVDTAAVGLSVAEMGLFCNPAGYVFPALVAASPPLWASNHAYLVGQTIMDTQDNLQVCTVAGTSTNGAEPSWPPTEVAGDEQGDNDITWTCLKGLDIQTDFILFARSLMGFGTLLETVAYASTWTITV